MSFAGRARVYVVVLLVLFAILSILEYLGVLLVFDSWFEASLPPSWPGLARLFWHMVSLSASIPLFLFYTAVLILYDYLRYGFPRRSSSAFLLSLLISMIAVWLLKAFFRAPRPLEGLAGGSLAWPLLNPDLFSYPSGHAVRVAVASYFYGRRGWKAFFLWLWAGLVCLSRVFLMEHWLGDVLAGIVLGLLVSHAVEVFQGYWSPVYERLSRVLGLSSPPLGGMNSIFLSPEPGLLLYMLKQLRYGQADIITGLWM